MKKQRRKSNEPIPRKASPSVSGTVWWRSDWAFAALLAVVLFIVYAPAWYGQPIWDDDNYLTPTKLQSWTGLKEIWVEPGTTAQYYPLVYTTFWLESHLWGQVPLGYHLLNILLQSISAFLLLKILRNLNIPGAALAAALFALHPVQVETVAWMTELKNCLSGVFCLASLLMYLHFNRNRRATAYVLALVLFVAALLSKSVTATLPAALLVIFWWKNGRLAWKKDFLPLIPFFTLGIGFGLLSAWMERTFVGAVGARYNLSMVERCLLAARALAFYLGKVVWPQNLTFIYPRWQIDASVWWQYIYLLAVLGSLVLLWLYRKKNRAGIAAFLLFAGTLFPALGFFNVFPFRYSFVADHFQYLACIVPLTLASASDTVWTGLLVACETACGEMPAFTILLVRVTFVVFAVLFVTLVVLLVTLFTV